MGELILGPFFCMVFLAMIFYTESDHGLNDKWLGASTLGLGVIALVLSIWGLVLAVQRLLYAEMVYFSIVALLGAVVVFVGLMLSGIVLEGYLDEVRRRNSNAVSS